LIVEDDEPLRQMLSTFLEAEGFEAIAAVDGAHAMRLATAGDPDVILLDIGLPEMDGSAFAREWRLARVERERIPIVVMSGLPYGAQMAGEIAAVAFFDKPMDLTHLAELLHGLTRDRSASP
jgi:two-component system KDP operon response regulator KdpE